MTFKNVWYFTRKSCFPKIGNSRYLSRSCHCFICQFILQPIKLAERMLYVHKDLFVLLH